MSILGNAVPRVEDQRFLTGGGNYVGDIDLPGMVHCCFVRSVMAHARITSIETTDSAACPGVLGVFTADDLDLPDITPLPMLTQGHARPPLARQTVRFVGEPIAVVVAESLALAQDAAEMVFVDFDPLDAVIGVSAARDGTTILHEESGTNLSFVLAPTPGEISFDECEVVVEADIVNQRLAVCPIEPRVGLATWENGRLIQYASSQGPQRFREAVAGLLGLEQADIRVITPDVGGGFGAKGSAHPEELVLGVLSREVGRPVMWVETRSENMVAMTQGRAQDQHIRIGGSRDGHITHYELSILQDAGAYPAIGAFLPDFTRRVFTGVYDIAHASVRAESYATSTSPTAAYRGAGRPEATHAIERAVDLFAVEIGLDPVEVRRKNLIPADAFPYTNPGGSTYDSGDYEACLEKVLEAAGYDELRSEQARRRAADDPMLMGIGVAVYVEVTAAGGGTEFGTVTLLPDGGLTVRTGSTPYGQGHATSWAMLASDRTGIPMDRISVLHGDTDEVDQVFVTVASRSAQLAGSSVQNATDHLIEMARTRAADLLEAAIDDIVHDPAGGGGFHVAGTPSRHIAWSDVADANPDPLVGISDFEQADGTYPFGAHVAVVEIDRETGEVKLRRLVACDDAGTLINPLIAAGQVHGGLAQGAAQALMEAVTYDEHGNPTSSNFADYSVLSISDIPQFERIVMETPTPLNPLGAKGIGEAGTIGSTPAVHNAVCNALAPYGVRHIDMPTTPEKVWRAIS